MDQPDFENGDVLTRQSDSLAALRVFPANAKEDRSR